MDGFLYCNHKRCHKPLSSDVWITSCSHIFCSEHSPSAAGSVRKCTCCLRDLPGRNDVVFKTNLNPPDAFKTVVLAGFNPSTIIDVGFKALEFLNFQSFHEKMFLHSYIKRQHLKLAKAEVQQNEAAASHQVVVDQLKNLIQQQSQECEKLQEDLAAHIRKTQFLEEKVQNKNRLLHKMLAKCEMQRESSHRSDWMEQPRSMSYRRDSSGQEHQMGSSNTDHMFSSQQAPAPSSRFNVPFSPAANQRLNRSSYDGRISLSQNF